MTLDQLKYFVAAAKFEHIGRAAQSFPISTSVVSHAVQALEEELGCELFIRDRRRVRLTPRGARLLELSGTLLTQVDGIKYEIAQKSLPLSGHYRVGASIFLATKVVTPVWASLQKRYPQLTLDLFSQPTWTVVDSVLSGKLDFGLGFSPTPHPHLEFEEIYRGRSELVVRKDHPVFKKAKKDHYRYLKDFPATMHIATEKIMGTRHHPVLKQMGLNSPVNFGFDNDYAAIESVKQSDNWSFMLDLVTNDPDVKKQIRVIPLPKKFETPYTVQIIRHQSRKIDPAMFEIFAKLSDHFSKHVSRRT